MGLMDRVKPLATQMAQRTQEAAREGKARLDQAQANRQADTMLRNLGALIYAERTGRGAADSAEQVSQLVARIQAHEAENGINLASQPMPGRAQAGQGPAAGPQPGTVPPQGGPVPGTGETGPFPEPGPEAYPPRGTGDTSFPPEPGTTPPG
jgi:hypothetical protein